MSCQTTAKQSVFLRIQSSCGSRVGDFKPIWRKIKKPTVCSVLLCIITIAISTNKRTSNKQWILTQKRHRQMTMTNGKMMAQIFYSKRNGFIQGRKHFRACDIYACLLGRTFLSTSRPFPFQFRFNFNSDDRKALHVRNISMFTVKTNIIPVFWSILLFHF